MNIRNNATLLLIILGILDLISVFIPITAVFGIYIIWKRPKWFINTIKEIYNLENLEKRQRKKK